MNKNKKKIILGSIIGILIGVVVGTTYAVFSYSKVGENQQLITGDIYMHYKESNSLDFTNALPQNTYTEGKYFEFTVDGKNTNTLYDIVYDIVLNYGDNPSDATRTIRIKDELLRFRLVEVVNNLEQEIFNNRSYLDLNGIRIHKTRIPANTNQEISHKYRVYAWISSDTVIGVGDGVDYSQSDWDKVFASIKVTVTGDFEDKKVLKPLYDIVKTDAVMDNVQSTYVSDPTGIKFYNISSDTNGKGVYTRAGTENNPNPIYYYRGNVDNNNVIFANKCWKIVRTTETGGTKMIYNGDANAIMQDINNGRDIYTNVERTGNQFEFDPTTNEWKVTLTVSESSGNSGEAKITFQIATPGTYTLKYTMSSSGPTTIIRGTTGIGGPGTNQSVLLENVTVDETFTIAFTYYNAPNAQTEVVFAIASAVDTGKKRCDNTENSTFITTQAWNSNSKSPAYVGYNYGTTAYEYSTANWTSGAKFGSSYTWNGTSYTLVDATETTPNATHHYSCNATNSDATCSDLRYVYYMSGSTKYYITLQNGKGVEDALKEMLSESTDTIKSPIHETINTWYNTNIKNSYGTYVEDTSWCQDRSVESLGGWNPNGGALFGNNLSYYSLLFSSYTRYQDSNGTNGIRMTNNPVLTCSNPNDVMSVANGKLENPVALLTFDETNLAGLINDTTHSSETYSNYLLVGKLYWLLSPTLIGGENVYAGSADKNDFNHNYVGYSDVGVRPALSLKHGVLINDGDGTVSNPYILESE